MISVNEIRDHLASYVANEVSFEQFEDWLLSESWNMHLDSSDAAQSLVQEIKAANYEYLDGYISEDLLRRNLFTLLRDQKIEEIQTKGAVRCAETDTY